MGDVVDATKPYLASFPRATARSNLLCLSVHLKFI